MFRIKIIIIAIFAISFSFGQGYLNGFGFGHYYHNQGISMAGNGINQLTPSFQENVSLLNPATWHNLKFTHLSVSYSGDENSINDSKLKNGYSGISAATWIVPVKSKGSFGLSIVPYSDQRITLSDPDTTTYYAFDDTLSISRFIEQSGGIMALKVGSSFAVNDQLNIGVSFDMLFGSSRTNEGIFFGGSSIIQSSRNRYSGLIGNLFLSYKVRENINIYGSLKYSIKPMDVMVTNKYLFDDANGNGNHDYSFPYDFPIPDSVSAHDENRSKQVHKPNGFSIGLQSKINKNGSISFEYKTSKDEGKIPSQILSGFNDKIYTSNHTSLSYTKFPNDLSVNWIDHFVFRTGIGFKSHKFDKSGIEIREFGSTIGFGFKFKTVGNQLDFNYYFGKRNYSETFQSELVQQIQVGISLADLWFVKRRQKTK